MCGGDVQSGADADATRAICAMLAGAWYGMDAIPKRWLKKLDPKVLAEIKLMVEKLLTASPAGQGW